MTPLRTVHGKIWVMSIVLLGAGFLLGWNAERALPSLRQSVSLSDTAGVAPVGTETSFDRIDEVWNVLRKEYVRQPLNQTDAVYGAIRGMVESLQDPYTVFLTPKEATSFREEIDGVFEGIGAEIGMKEQQLVIIAPLPDSPAENAGLVAGEKILAIDGTITVGVQLDDAVKKIRGTKGSTVVLTVQRDDQQAREVSIVREAITIKSAKLAMRENGIGVLTVSYFGPNTTSEFTAAVNAFSVQQGKRLVLDLRSNPGGFLDGAVDIASFFVEKGQPVVSEQLVDGTKKTETAKGGDRLAGVPVVVLVDQGTASAAEIVAGALQDYAIGTLVGVKTFGKGSVQQLEEFADGASLKVTVAKWLTPKGRSISDQGIAPDVEVAVSEEDSAANRDPQMEKAIELLNAS